MTPHCPCSNPFLQRAATCIPLGSLGPNQLQCLDLWPIQLHCLDCKTYKLAVHRSGVAKVPLPLAILSVHSWKKKDDSVLVHQWLRPGTLLSLHPPFFPASHSHPALCFSSQLACVYAIGGPHSAFPTQSCHFLKGTKSYMQVIHLDTGTGTVTGTGTGTQVTHRLNTAYTCRYTHAVTHTHVHTHAYTQTHAHAQTHTHTLACKYRRWRRWIARCKWNWTTWAKHLWGWGCVWVCMCVQRVCVGVHAWVLCVW